MKRVDIETEYEVKDGLIHSPGQFELQPVYVPHFWDIYLNGGADRDDGTTLGFDVTTEDKADFPELAKRRTVKLRQTDQGFIVEV